MRNLSEQFAERLAGDTTTLCTCWILGRSDGQVFGFTDHDTPLTVDGTLCEVAAAVIPGGHEAVSGMAPDTTSFMGGLSSATLTETDLKRGLWDNASVRRLLVDWQMPSLWLETFRGSISEIRTRGDAFELELVGLSDALSRVTGRVLMRQCDAKLGDARCGVDLSSGTFRGSGGVAAVYENGSFDVTGLGNYPEGYFENGHLTWNSGENTGQTIAIIRDEGFETRRLWPAQQVWGALQAGDNFDVVAGCDKRVETCRGRFLNFANFRGFPHLPGEDWVLGYPRGDQKHDGSSLFS